MLIVLPFCQRDEWLACRNLEWAISLDGKVENECLLTCNDQTEPGRVMEIAKRYFSKVELLKSGNNADGQGWPYEKNWAFQTACRHLFSRGKPTSFLWWEPDAVPLKAGWIASITQAHRLGNQPFTGNVVAGMGHMDAVGVYPWDYLAHCRTGMLCRAAPWDHVSRDEIYQRVHKANDLFQVVWDVDGLPVSFTDKAAVEKWVSKEAVLFHRSKDGTLIDMLSGGKLPVMPRINAQVEAPPSERDSISKCVVMLGRYGDVINILPILKAIHDEEGKPTLVVQKQFADIVDGVSYCNVQPWVGHFTDVTAAVQIARQHFKNVLVAQVNGRNFSVSTECDSFAAESWRQCGYLSRWAELPLEFDRRDAQREEKLVKTHINPRRKTILYNFSGLSSPYPFKSELMAEINARWGMACNFVDLGGIKCERIYDLLGLMDKAALFITTDTATLHLSYASNVPVVALITDTPTLWHGSRPRKNVVLSLRYRESRHRFRDIHRAIQSAIVNRSGPQLIHVYSQPTKVDSSTARRNGVAEMTWQSEYRVDNWNPIPVRDDSLPRLFEDKTRKLPYIKDLIDAGVENARGDDDIVVLSNTDTCFINNLSHRIREGLDKSDAIYSFRRDFTRLDHQLTSDEVVRGALYSGCDLYAFRVGWWKKHRSTFPDMVIGCEAWDWVMRVLMDETNKDRPCKFTDLIYHERHDSLWERPTNRRYLPGQKHNRALAREFLMPRGQIKGNQLA